MTPSFRMISRAALALWCLALASLALVGCQSLPADGQVADEARVDWATVTPAELERLIVGGELDPDASIQTQNKYKLVSHPIMQLVVSGNPYPDNIDILVKQGADINAYMGNAPPSTPDSVFTALDIAVFNGHIELARRLLELGANPDARERDDEPTLYHATTTSRMNYEARIKMIDLLLEYGVDIDTVSHTGALSRTFLMDTVLVGLNPAREEDMLALVRYFLSRGAEVNVRTRLNDIRSWSAMSIAVMSRNASLLDELIKAGGDVNLVAANDCKPPLFYFVLTGQSLDVLDALLSAGADMDYVCSGGVSILSMFALREHSIDMYEVGYGTVYPTDKFPTEESWIAYGDVILDRIKSLCEERRYKICDKLDKEMTS